LREAWIFAQTVEAGMVLSGLISKVTIAFPLPSEVTETIVNRVAGTLTPETLAAIANALANAPIETV